MTTTQTLMLICLAAAAAMIAAFTGCGGSDSAAASLTKKQFIAKADQICEGADKEQVEDVIGYRKKNPDAKEVDVVRSVGSSALENQLQKLKGLPAPDGDEATLASYFEAFENGLAGMQDDPASALDPKANPFKAANESAKKYGMVGCSYAP